MNSMKITILSITDSDKHFASAIAEYLKRLGKQVDIQDLKPTKNGTQAQIIAKDTENIISILDNKFFQYYKILLSKEWKNLDTLSFKNICFSQSQLVFVIGGPYGLDEPALQKHINSKISFGAITMPHGLVKLVLLEQIYRAETIHIGKKYHY